MTTLHIVRQSAFTTNDFYQCLQVLGNQDCIVFSDDGCYNVQHELINTISPDQKISVMVIAPHAQARAIKIDESLYTKITMTDLVSQTFENKRVITWQ